jgi:hypothetical protein
MKVTSELQGELPQVLLESFWHSPALGVPTGLASIIVLSYAWVNPRKPEVWS